MYLYALIILKNKIKTHSIYVLKPPISNLLIDMDTGRRIYLQI